MAFTCLWSAFCMEICSHRDPAALDSCPTRACPPLGPAHLFEQLAAARPSRDHGTGGHDSPAQPGNDLFERFIRVRSNSIASRRRPYSRRVATPSSAVCSQGVMTELAADVGTVLDLFGNHIASVPYMLQVAGLCTVCATIADDVREKYLLHFLVRVCAPATL